MSENVSVGKFETQGATLNTSLSPQEVESSFRDGLVDALQKAGLTSGVQQSTGEQQATLKGNFVLVD